MTKFLLMLFLTLALTRPISAAMPQYEDDAEFRHCEKITNDLNSCVAEQDKRVVDDIKALYRNILGNSAILSWNKDLAASRQILQDMYSSFIAYRTRICSVAEKASKYTANLIDEKYVCPLYNDQRHRDLLENALMLMNRKAPSNPAALNYLKVDEHDEAYNECIGKKENTKAVCLAQELARTNDSIKEYYQYALADEHIGKWNNGPDLKKGNYRDMFDSWIAYRNRMCSLAVWAYKYAYTTQALSLDECLLAFNKEKETAMDGVLTAANSALDDPSEYEDYNGEEVYDENDIYSNDDGGEAAGKAITPLTEKIKSGFKNKDFDLTPDEDKPQQEAEKNTNTPAWAR
ncbi:MAG: DUF1311 domain-containing protein [Alphaproteobacteria bacterium]|nr:DUF1311 domain-containing protein [Alphaproteobacteria bacterium]